MDNFSQYEMTLDGKQYVLYTDPKGVVFRISVSYFGFLQRISYRDIKRGTRIWKMVEEAFYRKMSQ